MHASRAVVRLYARQTGEKRPSPVMPSSFNANQSRRCGYFEKKEVTDSALTSQSWLTRFERIFFRITCRPSVRCSSPATCVEANTDAYTGEAIASHASINAGSTKRSSMVMFRSRKSWRMMFSAWTRAFQENYM